MIIVNFQLLLFIFTSRTFYCSLLTLFKPIMAKKTNRLWITLEHKFKRVDGTTGSERMTSVKNKKNTTEKIRIKKFSKVERKHVEFVETK